MSQLAQLTFWQGMAKSLMDQLASAHVGSSEIASLRADLDVRLGALERAVLDDDDDMDIEAMMRDPEVESLIRTEGTRAELIEQEIKQGNSDRAAVRQAIDELFDWFEWAKEQSWSENVVRAIKQSAEFCENHDRHHRERVIELSLTRVMSEYCAENNIRLFDDSPDFVLSRILAKVPLGDDPVKVKALLAARGLWNDNLTLAGNVDSLAVRLHVAGNEMSHEQKESVKAEQYRELRTALDNQFDVGAMLPHHAALDAVLTYQAAPLGPDIESLVPEADSATEDYIQELNRKNADLLNQLNQTRLNLDIARNQARENSGGWVDRDSRAYFEERLSNQGKTIREFFEMEKRIVEACAPRRLYDEALSLEDNVLAIIQATLDQALELERVNAEFDVKFDEQQMELNSARHQRDALVEALSQDNRVVDAQIVETNRKLEAVAIKGNLIGLETQNKNLLEEVGAYKTVLLETLGILSPATARERITELLSCERIVELQRKDIEFLSLDTSTQLDNALASNETLRQRLELITSTMTSIGMLVEGVTVDQMAERVQALLIKEQAYDELVRTHHPEVQAELDGAAATLVQTSEHIGLQADRIIELEGYLKATREEYADCRTRLENVEKSHEAQAHALKCNAEAFEGIKAGREAAENEAGFLCSMLENQLGLRDDPAFMKKLIAAYKTDKWREMLETALTEKLDTLQANIDKATESLEIIKGLSDSRGKVIRQLIDNIFNIENCDKSVPEAIAYLGTLRSGAIGQGYIPASPVFVSYKHDENATHCPCNDCCMARHPEEPASTHPCVTCDTLMPDEGMTCWNCKTGAKPAAPAEKYCVVAGCRNLATDGGEDLCETCCANQPPVAEPKAEGAAANYENRRIVIVSDGVTTTVPEKPPLPDPALTPQPVKTLKQGAPNGGYKPHKEKCSEPGCKKTFVKQHARRKKCDDCQVGKTKKKTPAPPPPAEPE